jgi:ADP-heptose:LPS heptosyltransferase
MSKDFKIWGMSYGPVGDLIMGLPLLTYFEKKYPNSYKYWAIQKRSSFCAPIYLNHPLIDRIKITDDWGDFGVRDRKIMSECDITTICDGWKHEKKFWYNETSCVEETARVAGIYDIRSVLNEEEMKPKLDKWFNVGFDNPECNTYSKNYISNDDIFNNNIAIYPFATAGDKTGRSPSVKWWEKTIDSIIDYGYSVYHYGRPNEPLISNNKMYKSYVHLPYFEQLKAAMASKVVIGTDSGAMWVIGAYSHPAIHLMSNWLKNHNSNLFALAPINENAANLFGHEKCDNIRGEDVLEEIRKKA